jgi:hypothetical protein
LVLANIDDDVDGVAALETGLEFFLAYGFNGIDVALLHVSLDALDSADAAVALAEVNDGAA